MPTSFENARENIDEEGFLLSSSKFMYAWGSIGMLSKGATRGYYAPIPGIKLAGRYLGGVKKVRNMWHKSALGPIQGKATRQAMRKVGMGAITKAVFGKGTGTITKAMAGKLLVGRVAGLVHPIFNIWFASQLLSMPIQAYKGLTQAVRAGRGIEMGGYFPESKMSYTSRQRSVQAITASRLQARSAIGNEAMLFHR